MEHKDDRTVHGMVLGILKGKRHIVLLAITLMIVALIMLHALFAHSIYKAGGVSLRNPLSYVIIGGFVVLAAFKLALLLRFKKSIGKRFKK